MNTRIRTRVPATLAGLVTLATAGGLVTAAGAPAAAATVTCNSPVWKVQFFANTTFGGTPKKTACDTAISENYGSGHPAGVSLPNDNFSARWSLTRDFGSGGPFTFAAETQDGVRVYLDGVRKIDLWKNVSTTQKKSVNLTVPAGKHSLRVDFVAWTGVANVKFTYTPRTSATVDKVKPYGPSGASVAYDRTAHAASLRWAANKEMDLAGYRVYRRPSPGSGWTRISGSGLVTATTYTDKSAPATGANFAYEIRAVDKAGNESGGTADLYITTVDRTAPVGPSKPVYSYDGTTNTTTLSWTPNKETDLAGYRVYRRPSPGSGWTKVSGSGLITKTTFADASAPATGASYGYEVRAVDKAGNESGGSTDIIITTADKTGPAAPKGLAVGYDLWQATLGWQASENAVGYEVSAAPAETGPYSVVATTTAPGKVRVAAPVNTPRFYRVRAFDAAGNPSAYSEVYADDGVDRTGPLAAPTGLNAVVRPGSTDVHWSMAWPAYEDWDNGGSYRMYRSPGRTLDKTTMTRVTCGWDSDSADNRGNCNDVAKRQGTHYTYAVAAVDPFGNEGPLSAPLTVRVALPPVTGLKATPRTDGVFLEWDASTEPDLARYQVFKAESYDDGDGGTIWLAHRVDYLSPSDTSFLHGSEADGETVRYVVVPEDTEGNLLDFDDPALNWVEVTELGTPPVE
ncbi:fibronectin type III domain-containing protein [Streptomyces laurentii]|uniref:fibronectin type III domain-containing protein n=1 Tax=Streptomyces laurentii TaxID=39478 RepID=UPI00340ABEB5